MTPFPLEKTTMKMLGLVIVCVLAGAVPRVCRAGDIDAVRTYAARERRMEAASPGAALQVALDAISRSANANGDGRRAPCLATHSRQVDDCQAESLEPIGSRGDRGWLPPTCPGTARAAGRRLRARRGRVGGWQRARPRSEPSAAPAWTAWALLVTALSVGGAVATFGGGLLLWVNLTPFAGMGFLGAGFLLALWGLVARR
jgi:hypothetical protein